MDKLRPYYLYLTIFITGAVVLIIEILGTRILAPFYGSTIFVWSSLISVTLGSLALGYWIGGFLADRKTNFKVFYTIVFLAGISTSLIMKIDQPILVLGDLFGLKFGPLAASFILFSAPLFLLGMVSPFVIRLQSRILEEVGKTSGKIFAFGTLGSLVGALLAGFFLIPVFTLTNIFLFSGFLLIVVALIGFIVYQKVPQNLLLFIIPAFFLIIPKLTYQDKHIAYPLEIVHQETSFYADLKVTELQKNRCFFMDGGIQTCMLLDSEESPSKYVKEIERLSQDWPLDSKILLLGLGGGVIIKVLNKDFNIDIIELDPEIAKLAKDYFNLKIEGNNNLIIDDARSYLRKSDKKYDIIISDLYLGNTMPTHLYSKEAVQLMRKHLTEKGILVTNIIGRLRQEDNLVRSLVRTQREIFPNIIVTAPKTQQLSNILVYASLDKEYNPLFEQEYKEQEIDLSKGIIITDAKNPLDLLLIENLGGFLGKTKQFFGYKPFFSI